MFKQVNVVTISNYCINLLLVKAQNHFQ